MKNENWELVEVQVDSELLQQVGKIITPMGLTVERLLQMFLEWLVHPDTTEEAIACLKKWKAEMEQ